MLAFHRFMEKIRIKAALQPYLLIPRKLRSDWQADVYDIQKRFIHTLEQKKLIPSPSREKPAVSRLGRYAVPLNLTSLRKSTVSCQAGLATDGPSRETQP